MHDAGVVERRERGQDLERDVHGLTERQRATWDARGQRLALEQLHDQQQLAALVVDLEQRAQVGMADARGEARLTPQSLARAGVGGVVAHALMATRRPSRESTAA